MIFKNVEYFDFLRKNDIMYIGGDLLCVIG